MKITLTGSLGHIGKPLTAALVKQGHEVKVISSKDDKRGEIESLGATAAIGKLEDTAFMATAFTGTDVVYCLFPPGGFFDPNFDIMAEVTGLARRYQQAISTSGVKKVVHLSSIGAHKDKNNGILAFHHRAEQILGELPSDVAIKYMRPVGFYYNLLSFIPGIKTTGNIVTNYGGSQPKPWVAPEDIATVVAEEITGPFSGRTVRYIASEEIGCDEIARILGAAIGKPDLKWVVIPGPAMLEGMIAAGVNRDIAAGLVEMQDHIHDGSLYEDYQRHRPTVFGKTKMKDFAPQFAAAYQAQSIALSPAGHNA
jgi:uncharacterized protein YbjT (DUF2867 family)